ncbi:beta-1,3-glucan-binding protein-like [Haliotis rubra]|uniref:beta-1,3-glucan-binding protein-like n=1 Tax=Haliotis rubra TaxID=36100 RepID=UPI001EE4F499|nr:beta-1,3-glucan-binding protein-like [Haliotis rubra]
MDTLTYAVLSVGLCLCSALPPPKIKLDAAHRNKITINIPDAAGVADVVVLYDLHRRDRLDYTSVQRGRLRLKRNYAGCFFDEIVNNIAQGDDAILEYLGYYYATDGNIIHRIRDRFVIPQITPLSPRIVRRGTTVLYDDFSSNVLDTNKWWFEITSHGGGSGQFQMYTPDIANTFIRNGILYIKPTFTADKFGEQFLHSGRLNLTKQWGSCTYSGHNGCIREGSLQNIPPIMSAEIHSKVTIVHGRVEVVAQIPKGDWLWPAIWLRAEWPWKYGKWPASGEIDIMETRGNLNLKDDHNQDKSVNVVSSTLHWGTSTTQHKHHGESRPSTFGTTWADDFHTFTLDWNADHIRMDVDHQPILAWTTPPKGYWDYSHLSGNNIWAHGGKDAPFDSRMGLILNIAVGATNGYFPDSWHNIPHGKPWKNTSPTAMMDFWKNRHQWQPTWHGDDVAMKVKSVKMIQY